MTTSHVSKNLWHLTAVSEVAPGREWILDKYAIDVMREIDKKHKVLLHEPISRYADSEAERRFGRAIHNARKTKARHVNMTTRVVKAANEQNKRAKKAFSDMSRTKDS